MSGKPSINSGRVRKAAWQGGLPSTRDDQQAAPGGFDDLALLTVNEVAATLRVSKMTVYRKIHSGQLTSVHFGRSYRIPATALESYLPRHG